MRKSLFAASRQGRARRPALVAGTVAAACACLLDVAFPTDARAADEDTSSQVYLVFDPETGEFVTSHDPNAALPTQTGLESGTPAGHSATDGGTCDGSGGANPMSKPMLIAAAAVVVVGGAGFAFLRSRRKPA